MSDHPDENVLLYSVCCSLEDLEETTIDIATDSIHRNFFDAVQRLVPSELERLSYDPDHYLCMNIKRDNSLWTRFNNFIQIASSQKGGHFEKYFVGFHGDKLTIFNEDGQDFDVCDKGLCMTSFVDIKSDIVAIQLDINAEDIDAVWHVIQSKKIYPNHEDPTNHVLAEVHKLVDLSNQSSIVKQFRDSVRRVIFDKTTIQNVMI